MSSCPPAVFTVELYEPVLIMPLYESTFIIRQDTPKNEIETIVTDISEAITGAGGKILKTERWGLLNLAYIIKKNKKGHYIHLVIDGPEHTPDILTREFKHRTKDVIRNLTVAVDHVSEKSSHMMRAAEEA